MIKGFGFDYMVKGEDEKSRRCHQTEMFSEFYSTKSSVIILIKKKKINSNSVTQEMGGLNFNWT